MQTDDSAALENAATDRRTDSEDSDIIVAGDDGEILDEDDEIYTFHREPQRLGGARYIRCTLCGSESVPARKDRVLHYDDCPEARR